MSLFSLKTPEQTRRDITHKLRDLRLAKGWRQVTLAERSGVSPASLRRFETSGKISLDNLLKLAFALGRLDDFEDLFKPPPAATLAELEAMEKTTGRRRGRL